MKKGKGSKNSGGLFPHSLRIISSCIKTVSTNASTVVRHAGASVAASISASLDDRKDQVTWAGFDKLELGPTTFKHVLLLGYQNGFQVFDVEDAADFSELVSKRDGPVTFLQMLPIPAKSESVEGFRSSYPLLLVVAGDELNSLSPDESRFHLGRDGTMGHQSVNYANSPTAVRFYSLRSNSYVQALKFRSAVCMVRCSSRIVAVGLATQICCVDVITLEIKFSVLTYPMPQIGGQGSVGVNFGYGPMALGPRWLAYATDNPLVSNTGRLSPRNLTPSPGVSPSTSPGSGSLMARYAMESSKHVANGIINLGDKGYKTLTRYCPDLLPESPSSPVSPSSGWKVGRLTASEVENAGMVVVKDFVSQAVISQFRAHTSPISALCFDPSGTLLVTASVHGNNINIFRIVPSCVHASGNQTHDWSSAHVHLYKLHRGITKAIIQDISFSHYSQWVAIISNKGTCHIYVLSPFGGDAGFETLNPHGEDQYLCPLLTLPWWSTSSFSINQHDSPPPPPVTLSVVSRIKDNYSGLLSSVTNAASSVAGKVSVPSGAVAAVFHNSISHGFQDIQPRVKPLEHLLVYAPSGYVVQYELLPLIGVELSDNGLRTLSNSYMNDDDLRLKVEPVQWWDVCRRSDWPEREESISGTTFARQEVAEITANSCKTKISDVKESHRGKKLVKVDLVKPHERSHWYLSNVEVQINSGRLPIWQKSKIRFYTITPPRINGYMGGELEIEQVPFHEVEIKRKDLLPVFDHFRSIKSNWNDRGLWGGTYPNASSLGLQQAREKVTEETVICHSKPASLSSTESSEGGGSSRRMENFLDLDQVNAEKPITHISDSMNMFTPERRGSRNIEYVQKSLPSAHSNNTYSLDDGSNTHGLSSEEHNVPSGATVPDASVMKSHDLILTAEHFDLAMNLNEGSSKPSRLENLVEFEPFFQDGYGEALDINGRCRLAEEVTDAVDCSKKQRQRENPDDGDLLGGMFSFSEEG